MPETTQQFANDLGDFGGFDSPHFNEAAIGLCLSGGGYKAAAYHLGALVRLNELAWLQKVDHITSVSGGSIAGGWLGLKWKELAAEGHSREAFRTLFVEPLRDFLTEVNLDVPQGVLGLLLPFRSGADGVANGYDRHLYKGATLQDLPADDEGPRFMLLSTNYELNSLWRFSQASAEDYRVGRIDKPTFSMASIVGASSAFPPFFCPVELPFNGQTVVATQGADRTSGRFLKRALLADGGIYDNMGLEPIWKRDGTLLVSNAGDKIDEDDHPADWARLMLRIVGLMHRQAENNRQRQLMILANLHRRKVGYWPLRNDDSNYPSPSPAQLAPDDISRAQAEPVRLWSLGNQAFARLANHGYSLCDSAMRSYLITTELPAAVLPFRPDGGFA
jgi:NTE family protein